MNKFTVLAIFAFAACQLVSASPVDDEEAFSQAAASENEDTETALLMGPERLFTDYCRQQREYVIADMKSMSRSTASNLLRQIFSNYREYADDLLNIEKEAAEELAKQIQNPDLPINDEKLEENDVARLIEQGKKEIAQKSDKTFGLAPAGKAAVQVMYSAVNSAIFVRLAKARSFLTGSTLKEAIHGVCSKISEYEAHITQTLEEAKSQAQSNDQPEVQEFLKTLSVNSLHCQTTKNIVRLNAFCEIFNSGSAAFLKMLGISGSK